MALGLIACTIAASAAATALAGAGFTVGTADALHAVPLFLSDVENCEADNQCNNPNDDDVIHKTAPLRENYFFSVYSAARDLLALLIWETITTTMAATTIRPGRKPAPKEPVVTRVPI